MGYVYSLIGTEKGRASDLSAAITLRTECFQNVSNHANVAGIPLKREIHATLGLKHARGVCLLTQPRAKCGQ